MMEEGTGFAAYAIYNAIQLHFTSKSYDYFKYHGKTNVSKDTFEKRKDKYYFHKLSRKYSLDDLKNYYIANFIECNFKWIGDVMGEVGESNYMKWKKRKESLTYIFKDDLESIFIYTKSPDEVLKVNGDYPKLLKMTMSNDICIETTCILNDILNFIPMWSKKIQDDIIWPIWKKKLENYTPFIEYDKNKYKIIVKQKLKEYA